MTKNQRATAFAALADVRTGVKTDVMESYFLAEAMKYFYLLFAPPEAFDFETAVFNTEAHPICKSSEQVGKEKRRSDGS